LANKTLTTTSRNTRPTRLDVGVFAHNEAGNIARTIKTLDRQDILEEPAFDVYIHILANGCSDDTVAQAEAVIATLPNGRAYVVHDLEKGGKSRTWNCFVHDLSRQDADLLLFCDADIEVPNADNMRRLIRHRESQPGCVASSSQAVKDIAYRPENLSLKDKVIAAAGGTLYDWQKAIIGSFYVAEAAVVRSFHLPIGLPVEDGFVRAMIMTDVMRRPEDRRRIDGCDGIFHIYKSERSVKNLIKHQVRLVIGSAINKEIFGVVHASDDPQTLLASAARDDAWVDAVLQQKLPRRYGYVPHHAVTKRLKRFRATPLKRKPIILVGFVFDCVVYTIAQIKMSRGVGAGFW